MKTVEIISLIYKSTTYLKFIANQLKSEFNIVDGWDIKTRIVANDANEEVLSELPNCGHPYTIYNDPYPEQYYLNRVYRAWNFAGKTSQYDNVCFVNSDMAFSPDWLANLLKHHDGTNIVTSRLVEQGKMPSGTHGISKNFGDGPNNFNNEDWIKYTTNIKQDVTNAGGLFMPVVFNKHRFIESGMYPEGNIYSGGKIGAFGTPFIKSGDNYYFNNILGSKYNMKHITPFDSIVYHFQEGEMRE